MNIEKTKEKFRKIIDAVAGEIKDHGFESLWVDGQLILGATITVKISDKMVPTVKYEKDVFPCVDHKNPELK